MPDIPQGALVAVIEGRYDEYVCPEKSCRYEKGHAGPHSWNEITGPKLSDLLSSGSTGAGTEAGAGSEQRRGR